MSRCLYMAKWKLNCWIVPSPERPIFTSFLLCWQKKNGRRTEPEKYKTRKKNLCHWICPTADENARVTSPCRAALTYRCVDLSHSLQLSIKQHTHTRHTKPRPYLIICWMFWTSVGPFFHAADPSSPSDAQQHADRINTDVCVCFIPSRHILCEWMNGRQNVWSCVTPRNGATPAKASR